MEFIDLLRDVKLVTCALELPLVELVTLELDVIEDTGDGEDEQLPLGDTCCLGTWARGDMARWCCADRRSRTSLLLASLSSFILYWIGLFELQGEKENKRVTIWTKVLLVERNGKQLANQWTRINYLERIESTDISVMFDL